MDTLKRIKQDLIGALITLGENSLDEKGKIKECDKILLDIIKFIEPIILEQEKEELYKTEAWKILNKKYPNNEIIQEKYENGNVWFEFYVASHDYSAGRDSDIISKEEIEKSIILSQK